MIANKRYSDTDVLQIGDLKPYGKNNDSIKNNGKEPYIEFIVRDTNLFAVTNKGMCCIDAHITHKLDKTFQYCFIVTRSTLKEIQNSKIMFWELRLHNSRFCLSLKLAAENTLIFNTMNLYAAKIENL